MIKKTLKEAGRHKGIESLLSAAEDAQGVLENGPSPFGGRLMTDPRALEAPNDVNIQLTDLRRTAQDSRF